MMITTEQTVIGPHEAARLLETMGPNRALKRNHVDTYARVLRSGAWRLNGESIKVDDRGNLLDGQHRLTAVMETGIPLPTLITRGLDRETVFPTLDVGRSRTSADTVSTLGVEGGIAGALAAAANWLFKYNRVGGALNANAATGISATTHEVLDVLRANPLLKESVAAVDGVRGLGRGLAAFCHYLFSQRDPVLATKFFQQLSSGTGIQPNSGVHALRQRLERDACSQRRLQRAEKLAITIKAWNAERDGSQVKCLRWQRGNESFPRVS